MLISAGGISIEWVQVSSVINLASNSGVGDVSQIYGVANPSNGDFGLKNAFWNIGRASSVAACALVISGTALRSLPLRRAYFRAIQTEECSAVSRVPVDESA